MVVQKLLLQEGVKRGLKASRDYSVSILGYDFIGLIMRLAVFYFAAFILNTYMIATIKGGIWLNQLAVLLGANPFPSTLPQWVTDLFTIGIGSSLPFSGGLLAESVTTQRLIERGLNPEGWTKSYQFGSIEHQQAEPELFIKSSKGFSITFWQIIQVISILLVLIEYTQYDRMLKEQGQKPNVTTLAVFTMIGAALSLMVFPQAIQKIKEMRIINGS